MLPTTKTTTAFELSQTKSKHGFHREKRAGLPLSMCLCGCAKSRYEKWKSAEGLMEIRPPYAVHFHHKEYSPVRQTAVDLFFFFFYDWCYFCYIVFLWFSRKGISSNSQQFVHILQEGKICHSDIKLLTQTDLLPFLSCSVRQLPSRY